MQATEAQRRVERLEALLQRVRRNRQRSGSDARPGTVGEDGSATQGVPAPRPAEAAPAAALDAVARAPSPSAPAQAAADVVEAPDSSPPAEEAPAAAAIPAPSQVRGASRPPAEERAPRHTPTPLERVVAESVEPPPSPTPPAQASQPAAEGAARQAERAEPTAAKAESEAAPVGERAPDSAEVHLEVEAPATASVPSEAPTGKVAAAGEPQPIEPVPPAEPRGAVASVTREASPVRALTFGELLDRSLSLRPR